MYRVCIDGKGCWWLMKSSIYRGFTIFAGVLYIKVSTKAGIVVTKILGIFWKFGPL